MMILKRFQKSSTIMVSKKFKKGPTWWLADFCGKKIPKLDYNHTCLAVITLDSALKKDDSYYPQVFFRKSVNILKKK